MPVKKIALNSAISMENNMSNQVTLPDIVGDIYKLLKPLESSDRLKVVKSAMTLLGEVAASMDNSSGGGGGGGGIGGGGGGSAYGTKAARWMKQYEISDSTLEEFFHKDGDTVEVIVSEVPGDGKRGKSQNCYLLSGVRALLESDEPKFTEAEAVSLCKHMGCHDQANHAKTRSSLGNVVAGNKTSGFTLPAPGLRAAAELVKAMAKQS